MKPRIQVIDNPPGPAFRDCILSPQTIKRQKDRLDVILNTHKPSKPKGRDPLVPMDRDSMSGDEYAELRKEWNLKKRRARTDRDVGRITNIAVNEAVGF